jgi:hypothetical protein
LHDTRRRGHAEVGFRHLARSGGPPVALGLTAPFAADADFSGIAAGLFISQAAHAANITVDEWGTEAAAVTGIAMALSAPPQPNEVFHADRPFAFAIVGGSDGIPLFIGRVSDPAGERPGRGPGTGGCTPRTDPGTIARWQRSTVHIGGRRVITTTATTTRSAVRASRSPTSPARGSSTAT